PASRRVATLGVPAGALTKLSYARVNVGPTVQPPTKPDASMARTRHAYVALGIRFCGVSVVEMVSLQQTLDHADHVTSSVFTSTWYLTAPVTGFHENCGS